MEGKIKRIVNNGFYNFNDDFTLVKTKDLDELEAELERVKREWDADRRELCDHESFIKYGTVTRGNEIAKAHGWDCFEDEESR